MAVGKAYDMKMADLFYTYHCVC